MWLDVKFVVHPSKVSLEILNNYVNSLCELTVELAFGEWDICEKNIHAQSRMGNYVRVFQIDCSETVNPIEYLDGSGNKYVIKSKLIEYLPVKMENSSSRMYSGGKQKVVKINLDDYLTIDNLISELVNNKENHIDNRMMISGMFKFIENNKEKVIIVRKSEQLELLTEKLDSILQRKVKLE